MKNRDQGRPTYRIDTVYFHPELVDDLVEISESMATMQQFDEFLEQYNLKQICKEDEIANLVLFLASEDASFITGSCFE